MLGYVGIKIDVIDMTWRDKANIENLAFNIILDYLVNYLGANMFKKPKTMFNSHENCKFFFTYMFFWILNLCQSFQLLLND
jgi:hypothetical protein